MIRRLLMFMFVASVAGVLWAKESYRANVEGQLDQISSKIEYWRTHSEKMGKTARTDLQKEIPLLQDRISAVRQDLEKIRNETEKKWIPLQKNVDQAMKQLRAAYDKTATRFHESDQR